MSAPTDASKTATSNAAPESPTTARPLEMDDDDIQESGITMDEGSHPAAAADTTAPPPAPPASGEEAPPSKPPRPLTEAQKNEHILKEAFPSIDIQVIKAVLAASGGRIDPAFNALLGMSDPDAVQNEPAQEPVREQPPPPQPPRPTGQAGLSQVEADELYARQLAEHYDNVGAYEARTSNRGQGQRRQATGLKPNEMYDREHSFIDDDLPVIRENLRKGFLDTQAKVNTWFTNLKKRMDGEYDENEDETQPSRRPGPGGVGRMSGEAGRRSTDYDRYDADPEEISDDFSGIRLNPDGTHTQGVTSPHNPQLYRPPPKSSSPRVGDGRKVAFKDGTQDDDLYEASPKLPPKDTPAAAAPASGKQSKWQPLSTVDPNPMTENDPFSLGDSEDEKEAKEKTGHQDIKQNDAERLKQATADAMADSLVDDPKATDEGPRKKD